MRGRDGHGQRRCALPRGRSSARPWPAARRRAGCPGAPPAGSAVRGSPGRRLDVGSGPSAAEAPCRKVPAARSSSPSPSSSAPTWASSMVKSSRCRSRSSCATSSRALCASRRPLTESPRVRATATARNILLSSSAKDAGRVGSCSACRRSTLSAASVRPSRSSTAALSSGSSAQTALSATADSTTPVVDPASMCGTAYVWTSVRATQPQSRAAIAISRPRSACPCSRCHRATRRRISRASADGNRSSSTSAAARRIGWHRKEPSLSTSRNAGFAAPGSRTTSSPPRTADARPRSTSSTMLVPTMR